MLWQITACSSPKCTTHGDQRVIFNYSININYIRKRRITLSDGRILTALFNNQGISNSLLVNQNMIPCTTHLSTSIKERISKCYCGGEEKTPDNLVAASLPSLRSPVNCVWNHINILSFTPIAFHSALTWKLSVLKINVSVSVCINQNYSDTSSNLEKSQKPISIQTGRTQNNH